MSSEFNKNNRQEDFEDLSITLIERRKRLHELADHINQWQDESNKHLTITSMETALIKNRGVRDPSPKTTILGLSPMNSNNNSMVNGGQKENRTPTMNNSSSAVKSNIRVTPNSNEILSVAARILSKRQQNSNNVDGNEMTNGTTRTSIVKTMRDKFENGNCNDDSVVVQTEVLPPKLLIKKFEQMSKENNNKALNTQTSAKKLNNEKKIVVPVVEATAGVETRGGGPRSIIDKFEQFKTTTPAVVSTSRETSSTPSSIVAANVDNSLTMAAASLTYISSMQSSANSSPEYFDYEKEQSNQQQQQSNGQHIWSNRRQEEQCDELSNVTSLFEQSGDDNDEIMMNEDGTTACYSISGSSYTGSLINEDEFESTYDDDDNGDIDQEDEYDSIGDSQLEDDDDDVETTLRNTTQQSTTTQNLTPQLAATSIPTTNPTTTAAAVEVDSNEPSPPLFSLQEYRKQTMRGRRRSSLANSKMMNGKGRPTTAHKMNASTMLASISASSKPNGGGMDEETKKKHQDRIEELEELIKQEDNVINQTGVALEKCLTDAQFTGSSQHIECNHILLISCQKRQAFLTEVNRLKSQSNHHLAANSRPTTADSDLTGLLIFSDLQLPIKELYIKKLASGEEKRVFYFICLIRNGTQVLQTQVISVQELIPTKETAITFPNRMAISNVDINFKVKIDIYAMEVVPKDSQHGHKTIKSGSQSSNHTSKFFSPFKTNLFHHISLHGHSNNNNNQMGTLSGHQQQQHINSGISSVGGAKTSNFIHIDTIEITNRDICTNKFKLNISSSSIPLAGSLFVNVRCMPSKSIELKGFMTLFEDMNGLGGSWDRRWCFLNNYSITFWKYPEDEYRVGPLGTINLTKCINESVSLLPRDLCARKYTIELIIYDADADPAEGISKQSQTNNCDKMKYKRYRLSADTRDQANDWLTNVNYALANLRIWNPKAMKPVTNKK